MISFPLRSLGLVGLSMIFISGVGRAQTLSSSVVEQIGQVAGNRIEALTILGGDHGASGGLYTLSNEGNKEVSVTKLGGSGVIGDPRALGSSGVKWAPLLLGNLGWITTEHEFDSGALRGNRSESSFFALQGGVGARLYMGERFSLTPEVSAIYGHTEHHFYAENDTGRAIRRALGDDLADLEIDTWSVVPALTARYDWKWGRTEFALSSRLSNFYTESFDSTSDLLNVEGDSVAWENKLDVDVPTGLQVLGRELHTGGYISRTELGGGAADGIGCDALHTVNGRMALDMTETFPWLRWLGVGAGYTWGEDVDGWSAGLDVRLKF